MWWCVRIWVWAHELITTAQHQHLNFRGGNICIFPSKLPFLMLPVPRYTRYYIVSFADIKTKMRNYKPIDPNAPNTPKPQQPPKITVDTIDISSIYKLCIFANKSLCKDIHYCCKLLMNNNLQTCTDHSYLNKTCIYT